MIIQILLSD